MLSGWTPKQCKDLEGTSCKYDVECGEGGHCNKQRWYEIQIIYISTLEQESSHLRKTAFSSL